MRSEPNIRTGGPADAPVILGLMDTAVAWLNARGLSGQWGTAPYSSRPSSAAHVDGYTSNHLVRVAELDGTAVGVCVLAEQPGDYVPKVAERELFVRLLVTDRAHSGAGIGAALIADARAETERRGISLLRVDCYAGGAGRLVDQYRKLGFTESADFTVEHPTLGPWPGKVLEIRL
jgi:GNAT superfamily N-acetyltransferase